MNSNETTGLFCLHYFSSDIRYLFYLNKNTGKKY